LADDPGWLLPASNGEICFIRLVYPLVASAKGEDLHAVPTYSCQSEANARAGRMVETQDLITAQGRAGKVRVVGVVPDGVAQVSIEERGGRNVPIPTAQNAYEAVLDAPVSVSYVRRDRNHLQRYTVTLPGSAGQGLSRGPERSAGNF
jgi:hypothetical protein